MVIGNQPNGLIVNTIKTSFTKSHSIVIVSHVRPDGDAVGSLLALGLALEAAGKRVRMVLADGVPAQFWQLAGAEKIQRTVEGVFDLAVVVDCSDLKRTGGVLQEAHLPPDVNIDHHVTNLMFGKLNLVVPEAVATSEILAEHLEKWDLPITSEVASSLLTGIVADTLGFRTNSTTAQSLRTAAMLMEKGADLADLYGRALVRRPFSAARYWGAGLSSLERNGRIVWATLTLADRAMVGYAGNDDADLINVISAIDDFDIAMIFVEQENNHVKISWRAVAGYDVSKIALQFGGGGHAAAAGADLAGDLESIRTRVLRATAEYLHNA